jgi:homoserine kinase type II
MASYTKISKLEAQEIIDIYKFGEISKLTPLSLGISNSNYHIITNSGEYLLKISNDKNQIELNDEQKILNFLKEANFPYSIAAYQLAENKYTYAYENYFGVLYPFVKGIPPAPSDQTCYQIGKGLATLHNLEVPSDSSLRSTNEVTYTFKDVVNYLRDSKCPSEYRELFHKTFNQDDLTILNEEFYQCLIHGDLYFDNVLFHNDDLEVFLDFEQSGIGSAILDLGISISGTCIEKGMISVPLIQSYLMGYQSVRVLPSKEEQFLTTAISFGLFSIGLWRIKRFTEGELNPLMKDSYLELLKMAKTFSQKVTIEWKNN